MEELSKEQKMRYARQIALAEFGKAGQKKICASKVLVIGCGALGSMIAMQLGASGVGTIGIADFDKIDISNIQRQFFFKTSEAGDFKVTILGKGINNLNPDTKVVLYNEFISPKRAGSLFKEYDFIIDATDNPDSKRMTGEISKICNKACCIGGVRDFSGNVLTLLPSDPRFEEFFGLTIGGNILPCSIGGVFGPAAAVCASIQASETLKYITNAGKLLSGEILVFSLLTNTFKTFRL